MIFPDLYLYTDKKVKVFYFALYPEYSLLFKGNIEYIIYNLIPIIELFRNLRFPNNSITEH